MLKVLMSTLVVICAVTGGVHLMRFINKETTSLQQKFNVTDFKKCKVAGNSYDETRGSYEFRTIYLCDDGMLYIR